MNIFIIKQIITLISLKTHKNKHYKVIKINNNLLINYYKKTTNNTGIFFL